MAVSPCISYHFYVEAGLTQTQVLLWVSGEQLRAVFDNVVLAEYRCRYDWRDARSKIFGAACSTGRALRHRKACCSPSLPKSLGYSIARHLGGVTGLALPHSAITAF